MFGQVRATYGRNNFSVYQYSQTVQENLILERVTPVHSIALQANGGIGVHYGFTKRWSIEGFVERLFTNDLETSIGYSGYNNWHRNVGVNYRIRQIQFPY
ncbi:hypothetical protein FHK02_5502 [Spirosoma sp. LMG 31448]|uniref:Outer membrane protein beta-barrel domain-containing protein n=1 Tax=Spirosoma utsteinense TaxID=2585773 RepID=A0ABR6WFE2_9BACT|nr:hypothetical protein [Spirosoma utsteinense]MBC3794652.1 hypothetical protein [Spirosoma utsteinense]